MTAAQKLLRWYDAHGRDLPWRKTRDPYKILVSEIMLHQTQVSRALLFYPRWLKQFPNWKRLASASNAEVIRAWSGLGYNRRALMLRDIARERTKLKEPRTSLKTQEDWMKLKGIGPYTAAAIAVFAFHERVMPIDTNIRRVLGRVLLGRPFPQSSDDDRIRSHASRISQHASRHYDIPQALFDLATKICTKKPECAICPLKNDCLAAPKFLKGNIRVPKQMIKKVVETIHRNKKYPDRIYRGRILKLVQTHPRGIITKKIGSRIDPSFDLSKDRAWLSKLLSKLEIEKFIRRKKEIIFLF